MAHCCERRDPNLEAKTRDVLLLHEQLSFRLDEDGDPVPWEEGREARVLSYDEKPGIRDAREHRPRPAGGRGTVGRGSNTAPDLRPDRVRPDRGTVRRDCEHGRLGTLSLLARPTCRPARRPPSRARRTRAPTTSSSSGSWTASTRRAT